MAASTADHELLLEIRRDLAVNTEATRINT